MSVKKPKSKPLLRIGQTVSFDYKPGVYKVIKKEQGYHGEWEYLIENETQGVVGPCSEKSLNPKGSKYFKLFS